MLASPPPRVATPTSDPTHGSRRPAVLHRARRSTRRDTRPNGEPSASDFLLIELPTIAETFGERFDDLLRLYPERNDYRYLVAGGRLVYAAVVVGQLIDDDTISLFGIEIDLHGPR